MILVANSEILVICRKTKFELLHDIHDFLILIYNRKAVFAHIFTSGFKIGFVK